MFRLYSPLTLVALGAAAAFTPSAPLAQTLDWSVGDRWLYVKRDLASGKERALVEKKVLSKSPTGFVTVFLDEADPVEENVSFDGTHTRQGQGALLGYTHTPIPFPLLPDSRWSTKSVITLSSGRTYHPEAKCAPKGEEDVTVPAGSFKSIRVECTGWWTAPQGYSGRYEVWAWFAPPIKWFAKIRIRSRPPGMGGFTEPDIDFDHEYALKSFDTAK